MRVALIVLCFFAFSELSRADDFFNIEDVHFWHRQPESGPAIFKDLPAKNAQSKPTQVFVPFLEVKVTVKEQVKSQSVFAHVFFYDQDKKLISTVTAPSPVDRGGGKPFDWPELLQKDTSQSIYFGVPDNVLQSDGWSCVVTFGDTKGVDASAYSSSSESGALSDYDYADSKLLEDKMGPPIERKPAMDPLIEHVVKTGNPNQPQITIFLRPPLGITDGSQAKGVLCMSLLAGNVEGVKRQLQGFEPGESLGGILKFAQDHQLMIICWGSHGLWDPHKNWDDLTPDDAWNTDKAFDQVANAWENGVQYFIKEYNIPKNGYLLWGFSGSAQYACRLALRKPDYFLAIHAHIPSSFDKPTPEGNKILWLLTTGEKESGYQRSLHFYAQCRSLGYPIIYKAIIGLGHAQSPISDNIGLKFFEYALSVRDQRETYDENLSNPLTQMQMSSTTVVKPWLDSFVNPAFVGDIVNQDVFPREQANLVPDDYRTSLPTKDIADAWNH